MEASSVNETRLCNEYKIKEVHIFSPSYTEKNIKEYIKYSDHLILILFRSGINLKEL